MASRRFGSVADHVHRVVVAAEDRDGFAHLRLGKDELRLTLANLICVAIYVGTAIVGIVLAGALKQSGAVAVWVGALVGIAVAVWLGVRLSLLLPSVFATGRISLVEAWEKTRGQFWNLLGMMFMAVIFYVIIWVVFFVISLALVAVSGGAQAMQDITHISVLTALTAIISLVMQFLLQVLQIVMIYAPSAEAYREITAAGAGPVPAAEPAAS